MTLPRAQAFALSFPEAATPMESPGIHPPDPTTLILDDHRGGLDAALGKLVRGTLRWARMPAGERARLARPVTALAEDGGELRADDTLRARLERLGRLLGQPWQASGDDVAAACLGVAAELAARGTPRSALAFAEAAGAASPWLAEPALLAGSLAARTGDAARAGEWLRRAAVLAQAQGGGRDLAAAHLALAELARAAGREREAMRHGRVAVRVMRGAGVQPRSRRPALESLLETCEAGGRPRAATRYALELLRVSLGTPEAPRLVRRIARLWMERGFPVRAVAILEKLATRDTSPAERLRTQALLARAAAEACAERGEAAGGLAARYAAARSAAEDAMTRVASEVVEPPVREDLGRAAALMGDGAGVEG